MSELTLEQYQKYFQNSVNYYQKYVYTNIFGKLKYLYVLSMNAGYFQAIEYTHTIDEYFIYCDKLEDRNVNRYEYNCIKSYCSVISSI